MSSPRVEKAYEKYAWVILFLYFVVFGLLPAIVFELILGLDVVVGVLEVAFGIPMALIAVTSYRKGRRWAWNALWSVPVFFAVSGYRELANGNESLGTYVTIVVISLLGLLLPYRKFFPRKQVASS